MQPSLSNRRRLQLILGKFPIVEISQNHFVISIKDKFGLRVTRPPNCDLRPGDLLTLYTEVLTEEKPNAQLG